LAAKTCSLSLPSAPGSVSYQTTHGTLSSVPVKAMSGSIPLRVVSTLRLGSALPFTRSTPVCWKQKPPSGAPPEGLVPTGQVVVPGPIGFFTKIWFVFGSISCQVIQGPGFVGSATEPPATDGFSASWLVWMFSDGTSGPLPPLPRPWPAKTHLS
jgi:hypothetical protein